MNTSLIVATALAISALGVISAEHFLRPIKQDFASASEQVHKRLFLRDGRTKHMYPLLFFHGYPDYVAKSGPGRRALGPLRLSLVVSVLPVFAVVVAWLSREETRSWGGMTGLVCVVVTGVFWRFRWPDLKEEQS